MANFTGTDAYSRFFAGVFDDREILRGNVPSGFLSFFAGSPQAKTTIDLNGDLVQIDIVRGGTKKTMAKLVPRESIGFPLGNFQTIQEQRYTTSTMQYPLILEMGTISASQLSKRRAGMNPYEKLSKEDSLKLAAMENHMEQVKRIVVKQEVLAAQSILDGEMDTIDNTTNSSLKFDFKRDATLTETVTTPIDQAGIDPFLYFDDMYEKVERAGGLQSDMLIIDRKTWRALLNNTVFQKIADTKNYTNLRMGMDTSVDAQFSRFVRDGAFNLKGVVDTPGGNALYIFVYNQYYTNDQGTNVDLMPEGTALMTSSNVEVSRYLGPSNTLPISSPAREEMNQLLGFSSDFADTSKYKVGNGVLIPEMFHTDAYFSIDNSGVTVRTQSAPIFATTQTDAFGKLQGLITP